MHVLLMNLSGHKLKEILETDRAHIFSLNLYMIPEKSACDVEITNSLRWKHFNSLGNIIYI